SNCVRRNDWGMSWEWKRPVGEVIWERMPLTLAIAFSTLVFMYAISIPVGIYSAVRRYSVGDHVVSIIGYLGLATPNFLLALVLMYLTQKYFGQSVGGLFSPKFQNAPWSWDRVVDLLQHLVVPVVVLGMSGTAFLIRAMRAAVLDELDKMYVLSAKASGLSPMKLLVRYPVRMALNPIASTLGWRLTYVISGAPIVGYVMALAGTGPLFLHSLLGPDMLRGGACARRRHRMGLDGVEVPAAPARAGRHGAARPVRPVRAVRRGDQPLRAGPARHQIRHRRADDAALLRCRR